MALLKFLLALLLFSSLEVSSLSQTTPSSADRRLDVRLLSLQHERLPGHPLRSLPPPILPRVSHLRHHQLHLRQRGCSPPELLHLHASPPPAPKGHNHRTRPEEPRSKHGHSDPRQPGPGHATDLLGQAMEAVLKDRVHEHVHEQHGTVTRVAGMDRGFGPNTLWYGEYMNHGQGAGVAGRVQWLGYHLIKDASNAEYFTVQRFIDGVVWLPSTEIKFTAGLTN